MKKLILASKSPRRKELLKKHGFKFKVITSQIKETLNTSLSPAQNAIHIAWQKALAVSKKTKGHTASRHAVPMVILAADTIVVVNNKILGKPKNNYDAINMLKTLSGTTHKVITAFVVYDTYTQKKLTQTVSTSVTFKSINNNEINAYVSKHKPFDKAGAYAIQEGADKMIQKIRGSFYNVTGLPIEKISKALKKFGILPFHNRHRS